MYIKNVNKNKIIINRLEKIEKVIQNYKNKICRYTFIKTISFNYAILKKMFYILYLISFFICNIYIYI